MIGSTYDPDQDQNKLAMLFGGFIPGPNNARRGAVTPGATPGALDAPPAAAPPAAAPPAAAPVPGAAPGVAPGAAPAAIPPASDDPAAGGRPTNPNPASVLPPNPTPPTLIRPPLDKIQDTLAKIEAGSKPIDYEANKPHWYDRIVGGLIGAGVGLGGGAEAGSEVGSHYTQRRFLGLQRKQTAQLAPLYSQLQNYEKTLPYYKDANDVAQTQFEDQGKQFDRGLKTVDAENTVRQRQPRIDTTDPDNPKFFYSTLSGREYEGPPPAGYENAQRRQTEDDNTPAPGATPERRLDPTTKKPSWQIRTKSGKYMPYEFKSIDDAALKGDPTGTQLYNQAHREAKDKTDKPKTLTPGQSTGIETRKNNAYNKARTEYNAKIKDLDDAQRTALLRGGDKSKLPDDKDEREAAYQQMLDDQQAAQDSYEQQIEAGGGTAEHYDVRKGKVPPPNGGAGAQPAAPPAAGDQKLVTDKTVREPAPGAAAPSEMKLKNGHAVKVGDVVMVNGKKVRITAFGQGRKFNYEEVSGQ